MDWEVTQEPGQIAPSPAATGPGIGEELATMDANAAFGPLATGRRTLGRRISHRKNPSDTFAFAAGQLFQQTPEDFYNLLDTPLETSDSFQGLQHAVSEDKPVVSPYTSSGTALQQAASAEPESAADRHTLGDVKPLAGSSGTVSIIPPPIAAANATAHPGPSMAQPESAADAAAAGAGSEDEQMSGDSDPEEQLQESDHPPRKGRSQRKQQQSAAQTRANAFDPTMLDPRRAKRILANRQSAQRSRMKRLQYIHDLENRSAATSATLKEIQGEVDRLQEQHTGLAEAVEQRKVQVDTLTCKLMHEQSLKATLISHVTALRNQVAWQRQQQQQQAQQQLAPPLGPPPQHQQGQHKAQQQQHQQHQQQSQRHLQTPIKHESYVDYSQQQQEELKQHGYMPAQHASFYQQRQQQQQQQADSRQQHHHLTEQQQQHQGVAYPQHLGGQPPVQQMHAMDLGHSGAAGPCFGHDGCPDHTQHLQPQQQRHLQQQQQQLQPPLQLPLQAVPVKGLHHHQQQLGGPQTNNNSSVDAAAAAAAPQQQPSAPNTADRRLQQNSKPGAAAGPIPIAAGFPTNSTLAHNSPSKDIGVDGNTHSPIDLGLASGLSPGMSDGVAEADLEDLLQDHTYLLSSLAPSVSGGFTGLLSGGLPGSLSSGLGMGSGLGSGTLRLTPSLELPSDMAEGFGHNGFGISGGLGFGASGSSGYAVKQTTEGLAGGTGVGGSAGGGGDSDLRKTLSM